MTGRPAWPYLPKGGRAGREGACPLILLTIYCDGAVLSHRQEKPGFAAFAVIWNGETVAEWGGRIPAVDVTHAELRAVLEGLRWAAEQGLRRIKVYSDSQAAVYAVWGACRKHEKYAGVLKQIRGLLGKLKAALEWIPREMNRRADQVCRRLQRSTSRSFRFWPGESPAP